MILRFLPGRGGRLSGAKAGEWEESQFCMGELELYLFVSVVNCCALTQPQRHRGTEDDGHWRGGRGRRGLSGSAVNSERGKYEAVTGGVRE
ncbi:hypothetical protein [Methanothrix sp.]